MENQVSAVSEPATVDPTGRRRWLVLATIGIAQLMVVLDATIVNIALPSAQRALGFSLTDRQWVVTAYSLAFGGLLVVGGRLSDLFGRKRTFIIGLIGFAAASALGGAAQGFGTLVAARAAQGAFGALLAPSALTILITTFTDVRERGKALAVFTAIAGAGGAVGLVLGGALTEYLSWRWCLYVNVAFALVALVGSVTLLINQERTSGATLDVPGSLIAVGGLVAIVFGFSQAATRGWSDPVILGLIIGGLALLASFVLVERFVRHPLVPLYVLADRTRGAAYLGLLFGGMGVIGMFLLITYYFQTTLGYTPLSAGLAFLPFVFGVFLTANVVSTFALRRFGPKVVVPSGMIAGALGAAWLTQLGVHSGYAGHVAPALVLFGIGISAILVPAFNLGPTGTKPADAGVASSLVNSSNQIGSSLGAALLNTIAASAAVSYVALHGKTPSVLPAATVHGDVTAFTVLIAMFALGALVTGFLYPRRSAVTALQDTPPSPDPEPHQPLVALSSNHQTGAHS